VDTHEEYKTYGYNTLPKVEEIELAVSVLDSSSEGYDGYEIRLVAEYQSWCEAVDALDPTATTHFWTLYGHLPEGGVEAISDVQTRKMAIRRYELIDPRKSLPLLIDGPEIDPLDKEVA
jgi:hypothetical protein